MILFTNIQNFIEKKTQKTANNSFSFTIETNYQIIIEILSVTFPKNKKISIQVFNH